MASYRYTRDFKSEEGEPQQAAKPMTAKQKRENFWFYYKWHVLASVIILVVAGFTIADLSSRVTPDYTIGVITFKASSSDAFDALEEPFSAFGEDLNGDGAVVVDVAQYDFASEDPQVIMATTARLMGDFQTNQSIFFLTDDVQQAQEQLAAFAYNDGSVPADGEKVDYTRMGIPWTDCPVLTGLDLGNVMSMTGETDWPMQDLLSGFSLVRRVSPEIKNKDKDKEIAAYWKAGEAFYQKITEGAS